MGITSGHRASKKCTESAMTGLTMNSNAFASLQPECCVQCARCFKWRVIPSLEQFEQIRVNVLEDPFFCEKKQNTSCEDPEDITHDSTSMWMVDTPELPKTPAGFKRGLLINEDQSKIDVYFIAPTGKRLRTQAEVAAFLKENPDFNDLSIDDFNFTAPRITEGTSEDDEDDD